MKEIGLGVVLSMLLVSSSAQAAQCGGDFRTFVATISNEAAAQGISQEVSASALGDVTQDPAVLAFDRRQYGTFKKSFEQYVSTRVGAGRINMGRSMLQRYEAPRVCRRLHLPNRMEP